MIDPRELKPGQRVLVWVACWIGQFTAEVVEPGKNGGYPTVLVAYRVGEPNSPLAGARLGPGEYGVVEVLS